jgi:hypothetical protein
MRQQLLQVPESVLLTRWLLMELQHPLIVPVCGSLASSTTTCTTATTVVATPRCWTAPAHRSIAPSPSLSLLGHRPRSGSYNEECRDPMTLFWQLITHTLRWSGESASAAR